jgi:hypothetical protein
VIQVFDDFVKDPLAGRQSALQAGFGTWHPNKGDMGASFYPGVSFWGDHATLFRSLHEKVGQIIPSSMFFRITNPSMEHALIHSDREYGENTAIVYLSEGHWSGTGFYKHKATGWTDMPPIEELRKDPQLLKQLQEETVRADDEDWQLYEFIEARMNRCLVFDAPKIHCRLPKVGYGTTEYDSRMVWVAHFNLA